MLRRRLIIGMLAVSLAAPVSLARKPGDIPKPGFNLFSKDQDIQLGKEAAAEVSKQYQIVQNRELQDYVTRIGRRLAAQKEADRYPYTFTVVNDKTINAFALPGGPLFVHSGLIAAADNEAQLAGVLGHEIAHAALRHGTNQVSKANLIQLPAMLGGAMAGGGLWGQLAQLGIGVGANSLLLKYSRNAETDADMLGSRIMAGAGYNPIEMARFFEKLEAEGGSNSRVAQFFSSHPNPGNRRKAIETELPYLPRNEFNASEGNLDTIKKAVAQLPEPPKKQKAAAAAQGPASPPQPGTQTGRMKQLQGRGFALAHPENWQVIQGQNSTSITIAPREGLVQVSDGSTALGLGMIVSVHQPSNNRMSLMQATDELLQQMKQGNPSLQVASRNRNSANVDGNQGLITALTNQSPYAGQTEVATLLTVLRPSGLFYVIFVSPERDLRAWQPVFSDILNSIRFVN